MFDLKVNELRNLNEIRTINNISGQIKASRIYSTINDDNNLTIEYYRDCLQKIGNCIQDLNDELKIINDGNFTRKDITYIILCVTWIKDSFWSVRKDLNSKISEELREDKKLAKYRSFIEALRSFSVAHPMNTDQHENYGFDGSIINVDIDRISGNSFISLLSKNGKPLDVLRWKHLSIYGLQDANDLKKDDFYFRVYTKNGDGAKCSSHIGCSFSDLYEVAQAYINKLYEIDELIRKMSSNHEI